MAVQWTDEQILFAPGAETVFQVGDQGIVIGPLGQIEEFRREIGV